MKENYYESAIRHYVDGCILEREECYDNAVCLMGISAECVLKCLIEGYLGGDSRKLLKYRYGHSGEVLMNDLDFFCFIYRSVRLPKRHGYPAERIRMQCGRTRMRCRMTGQG